MARFFVITDFYNAILRFFSQTTAIFNIKNICIFAAGFENLK